MGTVFRESASMSAAEYLEWERQQTVRHEFFNGEVFAQAGGTRRHSLIAANLLGEIRALLRGHPCETHGSDMRIHLASLEHPLSLDAVYEKVAF